MNLYKLEYANGLKRWVKSKDSLLQLNLSKLGIPQEGLVGICNAT